METQNKKIPVIQKLSVKVKAAQKAEALSACCIPKHNESACCTPSQSVEENNGACCAQPDDGAACCNK